VSRTSCTFTTRFKLSVMRPYDAWDELQLLPICTSARTRLFRSFRTLYGMIHRVSSAGGTSPSQGGGVFPFLVYRKQTKEPRQFGRGWSRRRWRSVAVIELFLESDSGFCIGLISRGGNACRIVFEEHYHGLVMIVIMIMPHLSVNGRG
jgi:hypothetical protein